MPGGAFKKEDNLVVDRSPDGSTTVRFKPVPAASTPFAVDDLIGRYVSDSGEFAFNDVFGHLGSFRSGVSREKNGRRRKARLPLLY